MQLKERSTTYNAVPDKEIKPEFAKRLSTLMDSMGLRQFGRIKFISEASGLSWSGAKRCMEFDKHPAKIDTLLTLFQNLLIHVRSTFNPYATLDQVQDYLLYDDRKVLDPEQSLKQSITPKHLESNVHKKISVKERYEAISPIMQARAMNRLTEIADSEGVNLWNELAEDQLNKVIMGFAISYYEYTEQSGQSNSEDLVNLAKGLIHVAKNSLL